MTTKEGNDKWKVQDVSRVFESLFCWISSNQEKPNAFKVFSISGWLARGRFDHTYLADELMANTFYFLPLHSRLALVVCLAAYLGCYNQMVCKLCCHTTTASEMLSTESFEMKFDPWKTRPHWKTILILVIDDQNIWFAVEGSM